MAGFSRNCLFSLIFAIWSGSAVFGQNKGFQLPNLSRDAPKPMVPSDLAQYFQLPDAGARKWVGSYLPGFIPPASFDIADSAGQQQALLQQQQGGSGQSQFGVLTASNGFGSADLNRLLNPQSSNGLSQSPFNPSSSFGQQQPQQSSNSAFPFLPQFPAGFNSGFSLRQASGRDSNETDSKNSSSSIAGIPNVFPSLPKAPVPQASSSSSNVLPSLPIRPEVPQGGLGPLAGNVAALLGNNNLPVISQGQFQQQSNLASLFGQGANGQQTGLGTAAANILQRLAGQSVGQVAPGSPFLPNSGVQGLQGFQGLQAAPQSSLGGAFPNAGALYPQQAQGNENLLSQLLKSVGLSGIGQNLDLTAVNQLLGFAPQQSSQGNGLLSNVIYNALTDNNVQTQDASGNGSSILDSKANAALIQNLLTQPSSPLCNPKPLPVDKFDVDAFTGKWYQVLYSPPLSAGPCSMITYQKLADVGQGGPGTVFDTFEYTTEATPYGKPRISSGYGIVRGPGQLIYRTTNSPTDVNVYVLHTGPMNADGQYEYIVLAVNCNYPLHVFARDPVVYKQKFESEVNSLLEKRGLVTSWSRLLNMVAPVDYNLCTFPPSLFNVRG